MQNSLFDLQNRYARLTEAGDPLERLNAVIDWEIFRPLLGRIDSAERKSAAGRKSTGRILMFKMLNGRSVKRSSSTNWLTHYSSV